MRFPAIAARRNALRRDWASFIKHRSPLKIAEVIERGDPDLDLPEDFAPWAPAVVIPSEHLLRKIEPRSEDWSCQNVDAYRLLLHRDNLLVRGCGRLWTIERDLDSVLAYEFGPLPVFTRTVDAAMSLAEYCQRSAAIHDPPWRQRPRGVASCFRWGLSAPDGVGFCDPAAPSVTLSELLCGHLLPRR
jgi:hypothetical protein